MPPPCHQHDLDPGRMGLPQRREVAIRDLKLGVEQRAVDIRRQQPNGRRERLHYSQFYHSAVLHKPKAPAQFAQNLESEEKSPWFGLWKVVA
jgi:hypothetical protein